RGASHEATGVEQLSRQSPSAARGVTNRQRQQRHSLTLWASSSARPTALLRPGDDLVLDIAPADGLALADGVAVDDHLDFNARACVDVECRARYESWRARHARALTVEEVDLTHVWEVELIAQFFLPATRLLHGLPVALARTNTDRLLTSNLDAGATRLAAAIAEGAGTEATDSSRAH